MRSLAIDSATELLALERALEAGPAELRLEAAPAAISGLDLLLAVGRARGPLVARFERDLEAPLAEIALACDLARYPAGVFLDLRGALLTPLLLRHGGRGARRLLAAHGARIPAEEALGASAGHLAGRSPVALRLVHELLAPPRRAAMARERAAFGLVMAASDRQEGIRAFRERRPPRFDWGR